MSLTLFLYHKRFPGLPVRIIYRIMNRRHQLLLVTQNREEAQRFIGSGYRICHTTCRQVVIREGRKKVVNQYTVYFVHAGDGTMRR